MDRASAAARRGMRGEIWKARATWWAAAIVLVASLSALGSAHAAASPARFSYEVCDSALPGGGDPQARYVQNPGEPFAAGNSCAQPGGSLWIATTGELRASFALWSLSLPVVHGGSIESVRASATYCSRETGTKGFVFQNGSEPWPADACVDLYRNMPGGGAGWIFLGCTKLDGSACPGGASISAHYIVATEVDPNPPTVAGLGGSLLEGGPRRGHQTIAAQLSDVGGGLSEEAVYVNGVAVQSAKEGCATMLANNQSIYGQVALSTTPCPAQRQLEWTLDTQAYPFRDGANSVAVCGFDLATLNDPNRGCSAPQSVQVDNSCTASAVGGGELLSAEFEGSHSDSYTAASGKGATISGQLSTNADDPVAGATLCVKEATPGLDQAPRPVTTLKTDANGNFSYAVKPGADRQVVIGYRHDSHQVARAVRFFTRVRPSLKLSPGRLRNGKTVHMWGQLPGPLPARRVVVLQANVPGSKRWITFRKATSGPSGGFRAKYTFKSTTRPIRYRFRALVPTQDDYPYLGGASKPASVLVRP